MDYQGFLRSAAEELNRQTGEETWIEIGHQLRNNAVSADSFVFRRRGEQAALSLPAALFYEIYKKGSSMEEVVQEIRHLYEDVRSGGAADLSFLTDAGAVLRNTVCRLVNHAYNEELLRHIPHSAFLDLEVVYYFILRNGENGNGEILLHNEQLEALGISLRELDAHARENTREHCPVRFDPLRNVMEELLKGQDTEKGWQEGPDPDSLTEEDAPLYILSNRDRRYGAFWMTDPLVLEKIAHRLGGAYYLLPSSVHECIAVPAYAALDSQLLAAMVAQINRECVSREEVLADSVYYYSENDRKLSLFSYEVDN